MSLSECLSHTCLWRSRWSGCGDLLSQGSHGAAVSVLGTHPVCDARELEMGYNTFVVLHWKREISVQILTSIFIFKKFC